MLASALALSLASHTGWARQLYRWVDDEGNVHYGDQLPPDSARRPHHVLDESGRALENPGSPAPSQGSPPAQGETASEPNSEEARRDRMLLQTFSSPREIQLVRDERLDAIDATLEHLRARLQWVQRHIQEVSNAIAAGREADGPAPASLLKRRERLTGRRNSLKRRIQRKLDQREEVIQRFETNLKRFRELKAEETEAGR